MSSGEVCTPGLSVPTDRWPFAFCFKIFIQSLPLKASHAVGFICACPGAGVLFWQQLRDYFKGLNG